MASVSKGKTRYVSMICCQLSLTDMKTPLLLNKIYSQYSKVIVQNSDGQIISIVGNKLVFLACNVYGTFSVSGATFGTPKVPGNGM